MSFLVAFRSSFCQCVRLGIIECLVVEQGFFLAYSLGTKVEVSCSLLLWEGSFWQFDETWDLRSGFCHIVLRFKDEVSQLSQSGFQFWFFS
jgi:hypothetical protein